MSSMADRTAMKVLAAPNTFELTRDDVNRHPGSLMHSLLDTVGLGDEGVPEELDLTKALSNSCLSTFTHATAVTSALYK